MITATRTAETAITTTETATATTATVTSEKFGIEIEFNNINRAKAAEIINKSGNNFRPSACVYGFSCESD